MRLVFTNTKIDREILCRYCWKWT